MTKAWVAKKQGSEVIVLGGVRTPFAKAGTKLKDCSAVHMGVTVTREVLARTEVAPEKVDEVVFGNAGTPADAANISRVISLRSGCPESTPAYTVHRNCASAMEAVAQGCLKIGSDLADTMLVGGTESMSNMPLLVGDDMKEFIAAVSLQRSPMQKLTTALSKSTSFKPTWLKPVVAILEGLTDPISGLNMIQTAEVLARDFHITRKTQDEFALKSHQKTVAAEKAGFFKEEVFPVVMEPEFLGFVSEDIGPRDGQSMEALGKLKPMFDRENGTVTAGNACPVTDGAVAMVLMKGAVAKSEGREPLGKIAAWAFSGCEPKRMGMGPIHATALLLEATGLKMSDIERVELNEAFSAQVIANQIAFSSPKYCQEKLGRGPLGELSDDILNVNGGAIALGHPVGATGARLILTLLLEMKRKGLHRGLATLCIGGGQGAAFLLERD